MLFQINKTKAKWAQAMTDGCHIHVVDNKQVFEE
jgi:hypothetical protein